MHAVGNVWRKRLLAHGLTREQPATARVLELSGGLGLPAVTAAVMGAEHVMVTEYDDACLAEVERNALANQVGLRTSLFDWFRYPPPISPSLPSTRGGQPWRAPRPSSRPPLPSLDFSPRVATAVILRCKGKVKKTSGCAEIDTNSCTGPLVPTS